MTTTIENVDLISAGRGVSLVADRAGTSFFPILALKSLTAGAGISIDPDDSGVNVKISVTGVVDSGSGSGSSDITSVVGITSGAVLASDIFVALAGVSSSTFAVGNDARIVGALQRAGGTMTGALTLAGDPSNALHAATKQYVDGHAGSSSLTSVVGITSGAVTAANVVSAVVGTTTGKLAAGDDTRILGALQRTGGTMTGTLTLAADPTLAMQAATKQYVDANAGSGGGTIPNTTDLTGTAGSFVGFDASANPAVIVTPTASSFVAYNSSSAPTTVSIAGMRSQLGLPTPAADSYLGYNSQTSPTAFSKTQLLTALGLLRTTLTASLPSVSNGIITLTQKCPANFVIRSMDVSTLSGSFTVSIAVGNTTLTNFSNVTVNSSSNTNIAATATYNANTDAIITAVINNATGTPTGAVISLNLERV